MNVDRFLASATQPVLLAANRLERDQWETHLGAGATRNGVAAWRSLPLMTLDVWIETVWSDASARNESGSEAALLNSAQARVLWRQVVADSASGRSLVSAVSAAAWVEDAWRRLARWGIDPFRLHPGNHNPDYDACLQWFRAFAERLTDEGWIDAPGALGQLNAGLALPEQDLLLLELTQLPPEQARLIAGIERAGGQIESWSGVNEPCRCSSAVFADPVEELRRAAAWASSMLEKDPAARIAVVVPELSARAAEVRACFEDALHSIARTASVSASQLVWLQSESALADCPAFGAALTGLELLSPRSSFTALSRWLRSPFFHHGRESVHAEAANVEVKLRSDLRSQLPFLEAYRHQGLRAMLSRCVPEASDALDGALRRLQTLPQHNVPTEWAAIWQSCLQDLGWVGPGLGTSRESASAWETAVGQFSALTPLVGSISMNRALAEFQSLLRETGVRERLPLQGVHVLDDLANIGPGYTAAWVCGFTDRRWPETVRLNPLLPRSLQVAHEMPLATPHLAYRHSSEVLERVLRRVPTLVFTSPARIDDQAMVPSSMLRGLELSDFSAAAVAAATGYTRQRLQTRGWESLADVPPPLVGTRIRGGARTLDLQSACPIRAFCEIRLGARELDRLEHGISPSLRGVVMHRALERWLAPTQGVAGPQATDSDALASLSAAIEFALREAIPWDGAHWLSLKQLEQQRMLRILDEFRTLESRRKPFTVASVEERTEIKIEARTIDCRIDRLDRLGDGTLVILDYKTGRSGQISEWFKERVGNTQLPLYALAQGASLTALVLVSLTDGDVSYRGVGAEADCIGPRLRSPPKGSTWPGQIERWRQQLTTLAEEFAAGDTRILLPGQALAAGSFAPLTRLYEHMDRIDSDAVMS